MIPVAKIRLALARAVVASRLGNRSVSSTAVVGILVQVGRPLVSLFTLPLLLGYLGQDGLGVWMIALSLMGAVSVLSAGLSASVVTMIGRSGGGDSVDSVNRTATASTLIAICWGAIILAIFVPSTFLLDWKELLQLTDEVGGSEVRNLILTLVILLGVSLISVVPRQIMVGRMHGYLAFMADFVGVVVGAVALIIMIFLHAPLWVLGLAFIAPSYLILFAGGLFYLRREGFTLLSFRKFDRDTFLMVARDSLRMAGYQSAYVVSSQSDMILIGVFLGAPASAAYGVAQRVFSLPILVSATVNYAQWPALARADAVGDHAALARVFRLTLLIGSGLAILAALAAALAYEHLLSLWLGNFLETDPAILIGMVVWVGVATMVGTCDSVLRARNETTLLMRAMMAMAVINISVTLLLLPRIGPAGAIWGSVTGFTLALLLPYGLRLRTILSTPKHGASSAG